MVGLPVGRIEDLPDQPDRDLVSAARQLEAVAETQPGLGEDRGRGDDLARSREPSSGDQVVADPARVAVIAHERDRAETPNVRGRPRKPDRSPGAGRRGDGSADRPLVGRRVGQLHADRAGLDPVELPLDAQQRQVHPDRERHCRDADDQCAEGHRGPHGMSHAGRDTEPGRDAERQAESQPAQATPVAATGRCRAAGDGPDRR